MTASKIDRYLQSSENTDEAESAIKNPAVGHQAVADILNLTGLEVSEAAVRRWRTTNKDELRSDPRILIWDIESSPIIGYTWGLFEQNVIDIIQDWKLLTVSWTWYGSGVYEVRQLSDFGSYVPGELDDFELTNFARNLLDEADYSVAHNGNAFDVKKVNAKIAEHNLMPPAPHSQIDTLLVARRNMKMSSNRLDSLGQTLGLGRKINHSGFSLWVRCMAGEPAAWDEMGKYATQDVVLLEQIFERLLPWIKGINYGLFSAGSLCTNCGSQDMTRSGDFKTQTTKRPAWQCSNCGTWSKQPKKVA